MLIGKDPLLLEVVNSARVVAATDVAALLIGEPGTGKATLARAMHDASPRAGGPFVRVPCGSLLPESADTILFGSDAAQSSEEGQVRAAEGGTLFLDDVAALPARSQTRLLGLLQTGSFFPVGASRARRADVRVVAASVGDPGELVRAGRFRRDLFHHLDVVPLRLPALREHAGDIPLLARTFLENIARERGVPAPSFDGAAMLLLRRYRWPGNHRELRNLVERLTLLMPGRELSPGNLPVALCTDHAPADPVIRLPEEGLALVEVEESLIRQALERTRGNRSRAARLLGITRDTLLYRLKKFSMR
jgi:DNA-binding NtrC family response regulator